MKNLVSLSWWSFDLHYISTTRCCATTIEKAPSPVFVKGAYIILGGTALPWKAYPNFAFQPVHCTYISTHQEAHVSRHRFMSDWTIPLRGYMVHCSSKMLLHTWSRSWRSLSLLFQRCLSHSYCVAPFLLCDDNIALNVLYCELSTCSHRLVAYRSENRSNRYLKLSRGCVDQRIFFVIASH